MYGKKELMENKKFPEIEDISMIGDINLMYSKLKEIKKGYQSRFFFL